MREECISVILTTYNRVENTLTCLKHLKNCDLPKNIYLKIFIADSNSSDNTLKIVKSTYPDIEIFNVGNDVFWNQGMRLAWEKALKFQTDYFLWLNDDTYLNKNALKTLIKDYRSLFNSSIIVGVTDHKSELTYGGRIKKYNNELLKPNGFPQKATYMNGNCVLVSNKIYSKLGNLNSYYNHSLGDIDYGLRAIKNNVGVYISSYVVGSCLPNFFIWYDPKFSFLKRYKLLISPKGLPLKDYVYFNYTFFGIFKVIKFFASTTIALLYPKLFIKIQKK